MESVEFCRQMIKDGYWIPMSEYSKLKIGNHLTYTYDKYDFEKKDFVKAKRTVKILDLYKDDQQNGCLVGVVIDKNGKETNMEVGGRISPFILEDAVKAAIEDPLSWSDERMAAYQCAYDLSDDWLKETPDWKDVQKAFLMGIEYQKELNKE